MCMFIIMSNSVKRHELWCTVRDMRLSKCSIIIIINVLFNGCKSESVPVTSGIPQGSVLGSLLFVIYINDLPDSVESHVYLFTDDAEIYKCIYPRNYHDILQHDNDNLTN